MFYNINAITSDDLCLYTDASGSEVLGFGGYFKDQYFFSQWPPSLNDLVAKDKSISIAFRELYPIVVAALLWGHLWEKERIIFMCDNEATVAILQKGRSKSHHIMPLVRRLTLLAAQHNFVFLSRHVPGKNNDISDSLSRLQMDRFRRLAPSLASRKPCVVPPLQDVLWNSKRS